MHPYLVPLESMFAVSGNPENALAMKKYMRNQFEYFGIKSPDRAVIQRDFFTRYGLPPVTELSQVVIDAWKLEQRELQYFAMELVQKMIKKAGPDLMDQLELMITAKSWWDTIDFIAAVLVGNLFNRYPETKDAYILKWMSSKNIWLQRTCLLFQLKYKQKTDTALLSEMILELKGGKEFFINKAIGWVLREYSKTDPKWVIDFTTQNILSNLSHREALKWIEKRK